VLQFYYAWGGFEGLHHGIGGNSNRLALRDNLRGLF